jgi:hypothetical protein
MIHITTTEVFVTETERSFETGQKIEVTGASQDRYWLTEQPNITVTAYPNALNKFCRELVKVGLSGPAGVHGQDGQLRFIIASIEQTAQRDLRDHAEKGLSMERYRPLRRHPEGCLTGC